MPPATAPIRYKVGGKSYGYEENSIGPGRLDGRPAAVDQPFGAGRVFLFAGDPFFRAWNESVERQAMNALLYPLGAVIPADTPPDADAPAPPATNVTAPAARAEARAEHRAAVEPAAEPVPRKDLPKLTERPVKFDDRSSNDIRIRVWTVTTARPCARSSRASGWSKRISKQVRVRQRRGHDHARDQGRPRAL